MVQLDDARMPSITCTMLNSMAVCRAVGFDGQTGGERGVGWAEMLRFFLLFLGGRGKQVVKGMPAFWESVSVFWEAFSIGNPMGKKFFLISLYVFIKTIKQLNTYCQYQLCVYNYVYT